MSAAIVSTSPVIQDFAFDAGAERLAASRIAPEPARDPDILTLAGLGVAATRQTIHYLLEDLARLGHASLSFDFSGNGGSTGVFTEGCIRRRVDETLVAARHLDAGKAPALLGTSMGGHLAASVTALLRPSTLILFCPAAYPAYALDVRFDGNLARPGAYPGSPAFGGMREFTGDLLVLGAAHDQVVPREVPELYMESASRARSRSILWLECDHFIHRWLPHQPRERSEVVRRIADVLAMRT